MLPSVNVNSPAQRSRRLRSRPISSGDTAATTGLPSNPNGTYYVANTFPQGNAVYGAQGQYGSGLPQVFVQNQTPDVFRQAGSNLGEFGLPPVQANPFMTASQAQSYRATQPGVVPYGQPQPRNYALDYAQQPRPGVTPQVSMGQGYFLMGQNVAQQNAGLFQNLANNPNYWNQLSPETQKRVEQILGGPAGGAGTAGNTDFMNTQAYAANADKPFMEQTRYYKGRQYKIKDLVRQGLLDIKTGRTFDQPMKRNRKGKLVPAGGGGGGGGGSNIAPSESQQAAYAVSSAFMNFNTATG